MIVRKGRENDNIIGFRITARVSTKHSQNVHNHKTFIEHKQFNI